MQATWSSDRGKSLNQNPLHDPESAKTESEVTEIPEPLKPGKLGYCCPLTRIDETQPKNEPVIGNVTIENELRLVERFAGYLRGTGGGQRQWQWQIGAVELSTLSLHSHRNGLQG